MTKKEWNHKKFDFANFFLLKGLISYANKIAYRRWWIYSGHIRWCSFNLTRESHRQVWNHEVPQIFSMLINVSTSAVKSQICLSYKQLWGLNDLWARPIYPGESKGPSRGGLWPELDRITFGCCRGQFGPRQTQSSPVERRVKMV